MGLTITKSKLQASKANASIAENSKNCKIENTDNDVYSNNNTIWDEIVHTSYESNIQLKQLLSEIDTYGKELLHYGKSSLHFSENIYELDRISNNYAEFSINKDT